MGEGRDVKQHQLWLRGQIWHRSQVWLRDRERILTFLAIAVIFDILVLKTHFAEEARLRSDRAAASMPARRRQLDVTAATADELALVPGMGRSRANALARARTAGLWIQYAEDLAAIPGFGQATIERVRDHLRFPGRQ
jgi:DNA uptake protein ComE-like DNA-binding protein